MAPSLCESCQNMRPVRTVRSRFLLCALARADAEFPKYPAQPVVRCDGYRVRCGATPGTPAEPPCKDT